MGGYRMIHRINVGAPSSPEPQPTSEPTPIWDVKFIPETEEEESQATPKFGISKPNPAEKSYKAITSSADGILRIHCIREKGGGIESTVIAKLVCKNMGKEVMGSCKVSLLRGYDGRLIVGSVSLYGLVRIWTLSPEILSDGSEAGDIFPEVEVPTENTTGTTIALNLSSDGMVLAALGCRRGGIALLHTHIHLPKSHRDEPPALRTIPPKNQCTHFPFHSTTVYSFAWNPHSPILAVGRKDGTVDTFTLQHNYDFHPYQLLLHRFHRFWHHAKPVRGLAFSQDNALLYSGDDDGVVHICHIPPISSEKTPPPETAGLVSTLTAHSSWVLSISTPSHTTNSRYFATSSTDTTIRVWDNTNVSQPLHTFSENEHEGFIWGLAFHPYRGRLMSCADDGFLQIYSVCP